MRYLIKEGEISILLPDGEGGALSGEVHLIRHNGKKYVVRRCSNLSKAKYYELISLKLEKYGFLPKFLGRSGKDVFYEYIEGRDLRHNERRFVFENIGRIGALVNKLRTELSPSFKIEKTLKELVSGKYNPSQKVLMRRERSKIRVSPKSVLLSKEAREIKNLYNFLIKKTKAKISLDISDYVPGNFRIRKNKVYLVDVESIKPAIKGMGIAKCFRGFCNTKKRRELFIKGYSRNLSIKFLDKIYLDLCHLIFAIQALHFKAQVNRDNSDDIEKIKELKERYDF